LDLRLDPQARERLHPAVRPRITDPPGDPDHLGPRRPDAPLRAGPLRVPPAAQGRAARLLPLRTLGDDRAEGQVRTPGDRLLHPLTRPAGAADPGVGAQALASGHERNAAARPARRRGPTDRPADR